MKSCSNCGKENSDTNNFCIQCGARLSSLGGDKGYLDYLVKIEPRMLSAGFSIQRNILIPPYHLDILSSKISVEITKFGKMVRMIFVTWMEKVDAEKVQDFTVLVTRYAMDNHGASFPLGFGASLLAIPLIVTYEVEPGLKMWMEEHKPETLIGAYEVPVLVSLHDKKLYYLQKTPLLGWAYYSGFRNFVDDMLGF